MKTSTGRSFARWAKGSCVATLFVLGCASSDDAIETEQSPTEPSPVDEVTAMQTAVEKFGADVVASTALHVSIVDTQARIREEQLIAAAHLTSSTSTGLR